MKLAETREDPRCAENMEKTAETYKPQYCCGTFVNVLACLFSFVSFAYCILLSVQTSEIKTRVAELETGNGELLYHQVPGFSMDQFNSLIQQRVDELLSQVRCNH